MRPMVARRCDYSAGPHVWGRSESHSGIGLPLARTHLCRALPALSLIDKVLVPALVAAAVTLLIERTAEPWLEVRKERILVRHRSVRVVLIPSLAWAGASLELPGYGFGRSESYE